MIRPSHNKKQAHGPLPTSFSSCIHTEWRRYTLGDPPQCKCGCFRFSQPPSHRPVVIRYPSPFPLPARCLRTMLLDCVRRLRVRSVNRAGLLIGRLPWPCATVSVVWINPNLRADRRTEFADFNTRRCVLVIFLLSPRVLTLASCFKARRRTLIPSNGWPI